MTIMQQEQGHPPLGHKVEGHRGVFNISEDVPTISDVNAIIPKHCFGSILHISLFEFLLW
jgi:hypothetical protein